MVTANIAQLVFCVKKFMHNATKQKKREKMEIFLSQSELTKLTQKQNEKELPNRSLTLKHKEKIFTLSWQFLIL